VHNKLTPPANVQLVYTGKLSSHDRDARDFFVLTGKSFLKEGNLTLHSKLKEEITGRKRKKQTKTKSLIVYLSHFPRIMTDPKLSEDPSLNCYRSFSLSLYHFAHSTMNNFYKMWGSHITIF